jgi:hypothetical protein
MYRSMFALLSLCFAVPTVSGCKNKQAEEETANKKEDKTKKKDDGDGEDKKKKKKAEPCPDRFNELADYKDGELSCVCDEDHAGGAVYGTGIYTEDSSPCAAAIHAGAIAKADGGTIAMKYAKGCSSYAGSKKNGVSSHGWGAYGGSFYFPDKGDGKCTKSDACPASFKAVPDLDDDTEITCACGENAAGSVWGSEIYTQDSSICAAAVHAGVLEKGKSGSVTARAAPGCKKYDATKSNGVSSSSWGTYDASFYFPDKGDGVCKTLAKVAAADAKYKVGNEVDVLWNGSWWQGKVLAVSGTKYKVHYIGYSNSWDEWVAANRVRDRTKTSKKGSGSN